MMPPFGMNSAARAVVVGSAVSITVSVAVSIAVSVTAETPLIVIFSR